MAETWTWDRLVEQFRALGGIADNVCLKDGSLGRGVFPIDPSKPVLVHAPKNLLMPVNQINFDNGTIRIKKDADIGKREREFFEAYERDFSWGAGGGDDCRAFVNGLDNLPGDLRDLLTREFGLGIFFRGNAETRAQGRFFRSRMIRSKDRQVIMPIVDLINHGSDWPGYEAKDGVTVKGTFADEVLVRYNVTDPFMVFSTWGFAHPESFAFSLMMSMPLSKKRLQINRTLQEKGKLGEAYAPIVKIGDKTITLSYLMLGSTKFPRLARGIFYRIMSDLKEPNAEEIFDRIQHFNRMRFLGLIKALEPHSGEMITTLRKMAVYQLEAISHATGSRQI